MKRQTANTATHTDTLDGVLVSMLDLHSQVKQAHWNVTGANFIAVHKLFDKFAGEISDAADLIAERHRFLGSLTNASAAHVADTTELTPLAPNMTASEDLIEFIVNSATAVSNQLKTAIEEFENNDDPGTVDLLTQTLREVIDQHTYLLKSHLG
jgi:starvation-inducible DNA-binding protein